MLAKARKSQQKSVKARESQGKYANVSENFRGGNFSQSDMNSVLVRDICFGGNDNASKPKQETFRNTMCDDDHFHGQKPLFLASSHAALAGLSNLFYAYNQNGADSLKWFRLYGNIALCLAAGEPVHFLSPIAGTPVKNGTQGRIVGWGWEKQVLSNKKSDADNDDYDDFYYDDGGDDDDKGSFGSAADDVLGNSDDSRETNPPNNNSDGEDLSTSSLFSLDGLYCAPDILYIALTCVPSAVQEKYSDCFLTGRVGGVILSPSDCVVAVSRPFSCPKPSKKPKEDKRAYFHLAQLLNSPLCML